MRGAPLELLAELVAIPSHCTQPDGIAAMADRLGGELAALGFSALQAPPAERRAPPWAEGVLSPDVAFEDLADPVVWHRPGSGRGELLILGDLDAALPWAPEECRLAVDGGRAVGPAVADMKGGLVVLLTALEILALRGAPTPAITVVLSGDEQAGSLRSASVIRYFANRATWCVCLECARDGGRLMQSRGHIGVGLLSAEGVEAHAGSALEAGVNAVSLLARGIVAIDQAVPPDGATVTVTIVSGGRRRSVVPGAARAVLDVRARDAASWAALEELLGIVVAGVDRERLRADLYSHRPGLAATDRTRWLLALVRSVAEPIGLRIEANDSLAAGSSAFIDSARVAVLDGMGPAGGALMTPDEYVEIDSIGERAELLAGTIARLAGEP